MFTSRSGQYQSRAMRRHPDVITDFCEPGLTVDFPAVVEGRFLVNTHGRSGLAFVAEHVSVGQVFTNPETGLSVRTTERTLTKDLRISQAGNLLTIVVLATGNSTVYGPDGSQRRLLHSGGAGHHLNCSGAQVLAAHAATSEP